MNTINSFFPSKRNSFKIFLFHGVIKKKKYLVRNYTNKHILEKIFIKNLKSLKKKSNIISLDEIVFNLENKNNLPKNTCAITFDDGFENNYSIAAPILDDFKIPATFYFSTDFIENNSMSWIDKIEYCLEKSKKGIIKLPWKKENINFSERRAKIFILNLIRKNIKKNFKTNIDKFVNLISEQCNLKVPNKLNTDLDKKINWQQVKEIQNNSLFNIGGHSHNHISLGSLSPKEVDYQINKSFYLFKKRAKIELKHYSYPEGQEIDYNNSIIKKLKKKNIKFCPTAVPGVNNIRTDLFKLKRIML